MDEATCFRHLSQGGPPAEAAVVALYQQYYSRFQRHLVSRFQMTSTLAEDVIHDTFINLLRHLRAGREVPTELAWGQAWLWTILRHAALDRLRKIDEHHLVFATPPEQETSMHPLEDATHIRHAWEAFATAHPACAEALTQAVTENLSLAELAAKLERTHGALRQYLSACRKAFQQSFVAHLEPR